MSASDTTFTTVVATTFTGNLTGNVTGNLTGNVTGNVTGDTQSAVTVASADGAITVKQGVVVITKGTAAALTIAAPTATTDDGKILRIVSTTAAAHTIDNTTPGFNNGGTASDRATFGAAIGNGLTLTAYQGVWYALPLTGVTLG